jgi:hypothetical protein
LAQTLGREIVFLEHDLRADVMFVFEPVRGRYDAFDLPVVAELHDRQDFGAFPAHWFIRKSGASRPLAWSSSNSDAKRGRGYVQSRNPTLRHRTPLPPYRDTIAIANDLQHIIMQSINRALVGADRQVPKELLFVESIRSLGRQHAGADAEIDRLVFDGEVVGDEGCGSGDVERGVHSDPAVGKGGCGSGVEAVVVVVRPGQDGGEKGDEERFEKHFDVHNRVG